MIDGSHSGPRGRSRRRVALLAVSLAALAASAPAEAATAEVRQTGSADGALVFASEPGDYIGGGQTRSFSSPASTFTASFDGTTFAASISSPGGGWSVTIAAPAGQPLQPGTYENATRWPFNPPGQPGLSVSGEGRGCNTLSGRFTVARAEQTEETTIFEASFVQHCEGFGPALVGQIRIGPAGADTLGPSLALPGDQTADADGPTPVSYTTAAVDLGDPAPTVACTPSSGSLFPLGTTTVACTATDAGGNQTTRSFDVRVRVRMPLSLAVSRRTIRFGQSVRVTARLTPSVETENPVVSIYARPVGGTRALVASGAVNALGDLSVVLKPRRNTTYIAEWAGDMTYSPRSRTSAVSVHVVTTSRISGHYGVAGKYRLFRLGNLVKQVGTVSPNHAGKQLKFVAQEYSRGAWRTVASARFRIRRNGSAVAYFGADRGTYRTRNVFARDTDHLGDSSPWVYFRVT